jgi:hypothetical protein
MAKPIVDYLAILKTLRSHGVDFVVVVGVCAVLRGALSRIILPIALAFAGLIRFWHNGLRH